MGVFDRFRKATCSTARSWGRQAVREDPPPQGRHAGWGGEGTVQHGPGVGSALSLLDVQAPRSVSTTVYGQSQGEGDQEKPRTSREGP